jgi:excisionase family DNA binding protein
VTNELLTTAQAAERLGLDRSSIRRLIAEGLLPAVKFGHVYQIHPADLDALTPRKPGWPKGRKRKAVTG